MKILVSILMAFLIVSVVFIAGCVQQTDTQPSASEQLTQAEMEDQAYQTLEQEMDQAIDEMTLEEIENELLNQG